MTEKYVTQHQCNERHGTSRAKLAVIIVVLGALLAAPCVAMGIAWSARAKAVVNEARQAAQDDKLDAIHEDVRENRALLHQVLRNRKED